MNADLQEWENRIKKSLAAQLQSDKSIVSATISLMKMPPSARMMKMPPSARIEIAGGLGMDTSALRVENDPAMQAQAIMHSAIDGKQHELCSQLINDAVSQLKNSPSK